MFGCYYGTSRQWVEQNLDAGRHVVLVIDTQGAMQVKLLVPVVSIFVMPPSLDELKRRLFERQTDSPETIARRLVRAEEEIAMGNHYDYLIVNDDLGTAYQVLRSIVIAEGHKLKNHV